MQISFFEEFPTARNLDRLDLVDWPTKLYLAASSLREFGKIKSQIKNKHVREIVYWPILKKKEGYWISPFSSRKALIRIFSELQGKKIPMMLDLELPTTKNPFLYLTQGLNFFRNKTLISDFIQDYAGQVYLAEYYPQGRLKEKAMIFFGLHYLNKKVNVIKMIYHSMHRFNENFIRDEMKLGREEYGDRFLVAYGTIAKGIQRNEPILSLKQLKNDLGLAKRAGVKEVVIYRLGGLSEEYARYLES